MGTKKMTREEMMFTLTGDYQYGDTINRTQREASTVMRGHTIYEGQPNDHFDTELKQR